MIKFYWYISYNGRPESDLTYVKDKCYHGFRDEPDYEVVEGYDLRDEFYGTVEDLKVKYKL